MTALDDTVARYHKILETPEYHDPNWAKSVHDLMVARNLTPGGRAVCPVMRPHFITRRQYDGMAKAAETLYAAMDRLRQMVLSTPALLNRLEMLPAEKMLATLDPGYPYLAVANLLDTHIQNGSCRVTETDGYLPSGVVFNDALTEIFWDSAPMKVLRKKYKFSRSTGMKKLLHSLLSAYKVSGKKKFPRIAIVEFRPPFKSTPSPEHLMIAEYFRAAGYPTEVITPEELEYRNGVLCRKDFGIEIVYRKVSAHDFLVRFDLGHPLVRAYRERTVCMVNSFRTEMLQKKAMLSLLTDETVVEKFPTAEKKAIRDHMPWTRMVTQSRTTIHGKQVELLDYIQQNRANLVLKPNDASGDLHSFRGWEVDDAGWDRAMRTALRNAYVVQERTEAPVTPFPVYQFGKLEQRNMAVEVHPHIYLGKVDGCSTEISDASSGFSTLTGVVPAFVLEGAS